MVNPSALQQWSYWLYRMLKIRMFEEKLNQLFALGHIHGTIHLYVGEEAVAVGVCGALENRDCITSTHRGHGHFIARGGDVKRIMAEIWGLKEGYCGGKGGTQHMADFSIGNIGSNGITGGPIHIHPGTGSFQDAGHRGPGGRLWHAWLYRRRHGRGRGEQGGRGGGRSGAAG